MAKRAKQKIVALTPAQVEAPPPWERDEMHLSEVPAFIKHRWNISVALRTVRRWIYQGHRRGEGKEGRAYLVTVSRAGRSFVRSPDLVKFMEAT